MLLRILSILALKALLSAACEEKYWKVLEDFNVIKPHFLVENRKQIKSIFNSYEKPCKVSFISEYSSSKLTENQLIFCLSKSSTLQEKDFEQILNFSKEGQVWSRKIWLIFGRTDF